MKEIVLPSSGDFARFDQIKFSDIMACIGSKEPMVEALILRLVTVEGRKLDSKRLDEMPLCDAIVIANAIAAELKPLGSAAPVA